MENYYGFSIEKIRNDLVTCSPSRFPPKYSKYVNFCNDEFKKTKDFQKNADIYITKRDY